MEKFTKENALKSFIFNLIANTVIPAVILRNEAVVYLKEGETTLLPTLLAGVAFSVMITCLITFITMTAQRKAGKIKLPIYPTSNWFPRAVVEGILITIGFVFITWILFFVLQSTTTNVAISKPTVLLISALLGASVGYISSLIASNRAAKIR